jgi:Tol biopolymer transport system component
VYSQTSGGHENEFAWIDNRGEHTPIFQSSVYLNAALSPDGSRIAFDVIDDRSSKTAIWVYDIASKSKMRLTFSANGGSRPVWSSDGSNIYYNMEVGGSKAAIAVKRTDGSGEEELLVHGAAGTNVGYYGLDVSPDGRILLLGVSNESKSELATVDLQGKEKPLPIRMMGIQGSNAKFSPDGRWIVYESRESGTPNIYVGSFGAGSGKWQLTQDGGNRPLWAKDNITYYSPTRNRQEEVDVTLASGSPAFGQPRALFPPAKQQNTIIYGVAKDGQKYLGLRRVNAGTSGYLSIVVNWQSLLEAN